MKECKGFTSWIIINKPYGEFGWSGIAWTDNPDDVFVYKSYKDALSALSYYKSIKGFEEACVFKLDGFRK